LAARAHAFPKLNRASSALVCQTTLGGNGYYGVCGIAVCGLGQVYVAGSAGSADFPTTPGAYDETWNGADDVFVARLSMASPVPPLYGVYLPLTRGG